MAMSVRRSGALQFALLVIVMAMVIMGARVSQTVRSCERQAGQFANGPSDDAAIRRTVCPVVPGWLSVVATGHSSRFELR
jgi:hypothetical protein